MKCRRATYFTDLGMIKYYQKTCGWKSKKTKKYIRNYDRYTTLKNHFLCFTLGNIALFKEYWNLWSTISLLKPWHCIDF